MIKSFKDLQQLITSVPNPETEIDWHSYGEVNVKRDDNLLLFSYMKTCQFKLPIEWNWFERVSRGLVVDIGTGEVLALPFEKFWNYGEVFPTGEPIEITEKLDGSLGICFYNPWKDKWQIVTRGSFDSEQAQWAQEYLDEHYDLFKVNPNLTLLFEIIYPENRIVVDYGDRNTLILIGMRSSVAGTDFWLPSLKGFSDLYKFPLPKVYAVEDISSLVEKAESLGVSAEGWVVRYSDGTRVKVKGLAYLEAHRWLNQITPKRIAGLLALGDLSFIKEVPESVRPEVERVVCEVAEEAFHIRNRVEDAFVNAPKESRKEFALWVKENHPELSFYLFKRLDGKFDESLIYEKEF